MSQSTPDFTALLELAESVALAAGELLANRPATFALSEKTSAVDFATQMDIASEKLIVESLLAARPNDGIIGEEGAARESTSGITWVIDPLDGTVNYFYGLPGWNVSIAAKDATGVCVGVVYSPTTNSLWSATRGGGARFNGEVIRCNDPVELEMALLGTGFAYDRERRKFQADVVARQIGRSHD
jgi:myo-inositol-1(or 4)-monophosphatase